MTEADLREINGLVAQFYDPTRLGQTQRRYRIQMDLLARGVHLDHPLTAPSGPATDCAYPCA